ncbi:MAG TPA: benzoyl-CoA 2,3-epoxidase subunit BoxB, partial [Acidimicrobiia bacterium]
SVELDVPDGKGGIRVESVPLRNAMNEVVRNSYVEDCMRGLGRWNRLIEGAGHAFRFSLPSTRFRRTIGNWANVATDPAGQPISQAQYDAQIASWLPSDADRAFIASLMVRVVEPGKMAGWIAPPEKGIKDRSIDYDYVRLA